MDSSARLRKIAFYTIGNDSLPSTWFRVCQYFPEFKKAGIDVDLYSLTRPATENKVKNLFGLFGQAFLKLSQLSHAKDYDLIVVQKGLTSWRCRGLAGYLRSLGVPYLMDIDDAIFTLIDTRFPSYLRWTQDEDEPGKILEGAAQVIVGNRYLADTVALRNGRVSIIPTPIDTEAYRPMMRKKDEKIIVGWSGSSGTNEYLNDLLPIIGEVSKTLSFRFHIISNNLKNLNTSVLEGSDWHFIEWKKETEIAELSRLDIGLMPLRDDEWCRGKCGLKALQYMALGIPAVCSPVGINTEIVENGVNGFLADDPNAWAQKIATLIQNETLRKECGMEARKTVEQKYSVEVNFKKMIEVMERVVANGKQ